MKESHRLFLVLVILSIFTIFVLSSYSARHGTVYADPALSDRDGHLCRLEEVKACAMSFPIFSACKIFQARKGYKTLDVYYPPLFHALFYLLSFLTNGNIILAINVFFPFLVVVCIPMTIYGISTYYLTNEKRITSVFFYVLGVGSIFSFIHWATYPHALFTWFFLVAVLFMLKYMGNQTTLNIVGVYLFSILAFFTHVSGAIYIVLVFLAFLLLQRRYIDFLAMFSIVGFASLLFPGLWTRLFFYLEGNVFQKIGLTNLVPWIFHRLYMIENAVYFWISPIVILFFIYGIGKIEHLNRQWALLGVCIGLPFLTLFLVTQFRPFLNAFPFMCILAVKGFNPPKRIEFLVYAFIALFFLVTLKRVVAFEMLPLWYP